MGLSSNILWHQTNYYNLRKILKDKTILCSYGLEDVSFVLGEKVAFPMVSMCDLPFSEMSSYQGKYGDYAIGLSRSWGIRNKFNPVWYCDPQSIVGDAFRKSFNKIDDKDHIHEFLLLINVLSFVKQVEGDLRNHNYESYRFYDEREVRYVPSLFEIRKTKHIPFLTETDYEKYKTSNEGSSTLDFGVSFEWTDIKYLIVKEDRHIPVFRALLNKLGCPQDIVSIFSSVQVKDDFIGSNHNKELAVNQSRRNTFETFLKAYSDLLQGD